MIKVYSLLEGSFESLGDGPYQKKHSPNAEVQGISKPEARNPRPPTLNPIDSLTITLAASQYPLIKEYTLNHNIKAPINLRYTP